jgi:diacylglycerol kinase (ATP)
LLTFRLEVYLLVVDGSLAPLALWLGAERPGTRAGADRRGGAGVAGRCLLVLAAELLNSAIEAVIERYGPEFHELAGRAKDMGSAAVFVLMMNVMMCWGLMCCRAICERFF